MSFFWGHFRLIYWIEISTLLWNLISNNTFLILTLNYLIFKLGPDHTRSDIYINWVLYKYIFLILLLNISRYIRVRSNKFITYWICWRIHHFIWLNKWWIFYLMVLFHIFIEFIFWGCFKEVFVLFNIFVSTICKYFIVCFQILIWFLIEELRIFGIFNRWLSDKIH